MLTVFRSNRAELLARLLAQQLRLAPPDPFERVEVMVNTWPTSRWLGEQLAIHLGGVAANLRFPFPAQHLRRLLERLPLDDRRQDAAEPAEPLLLDAAEAMAVDPWRADRLVWPLLELLPEVAGGPAGEPLRRWLEGADPRRRLDLPAWRLGRSLADAFDDYALYRPEMLAAWEAGRPHDGRGRPLPAALAWQPALYRALRARLDREPFGLRVERLIARLRTGAPLDGLPTGPLRLFGLSSLAPVQVRLLQALSGRIPVDLYLLTPCRDLWQRCADRRRELRDALALEVPLDADWLLAAPGLEARFGRLGAEFQQLLEGTGEAQLGASDERDLFFAPATAQRRARSGGPPTLLAQLQEHLAEARPAALELDAADRSLEFHPCPGRLRQVQIVRDRVLQLLASDPSLEPRDVLVMTPAVDRFAPLLASVFGDAAATGVDLPWRLTDRSQQSEAGLGRTLLQLLRLAGERVTATALEGLLDCPPLRQRFGLEPRDSGRITALLQRVGLRWGLDAEERGGDPVHSLGWVIDRLLLGVALPDDPGLAPAGTAPFAGPGLERLGPWLHVLLRLRHWLRELRRPATLPTWHGRLRGLLADLFGDGGEAAWELPPLLAALDAWREAAAVTGAELEAAVVAAALEEGLAVDSGRFGHRSGALTISALEPMRAIPHRVVVLMGLDADAFPRQRPRPGFHLLEQQRRLGDPHPPDQDRYVLLEALLSARDHLLLCWSCRDDRSGEPLPPAAPVRQWLDWLRVCLGEGADRLVHHHAASPLDARNFLATADRPPPSCDRRLLDTRRRLDAGGLDPPAGLLRAAMPAVPSVDPGGSGIDRFDDLRAWLMEPQRCWLRGLGLRPGEAQAAVEDLELLALEERQRVRLLAGVLDHDLLEEAAAAGWRFWTARERGRGTLPAASGGELEARLLQGRLITLVSGLAGLGPERGGPLAWQGWQASPHRRGDAVVLVHGGATGVVQAMDLWLQLLLTAAAGEAPRRGVLFCRSSRDRTVFGPELELAAPSAAAAAAELDRLAELRAVWRAPCWPLPPRTAWAWLVAERRRAGSGAAAARAVWEGRPGTFAERDRAEMLVCFGDAPPLEALFDDRFVEEALRLYGPLLEARR